MTAHDFASLLKARKIGRGKWIARCPAHPDRNPSLSIAEGRKVPILIKCMSAGCEPAAILAAMGLGWNALMGDSDDRGDMTAILKERARQEAKEREERSIHGNLCLQARWWEDQASGWGRYLAEHPEDDTFVPYFHRALRSIRILNAAIAPFRHVSMYPTENIGRRRTWTKASAPQTSTGA